MSSLSEKELRRQQEAELWQEWRKGRALPVRHALVEHHLGWVRLIVREVQAEFRAPHAEWSDYLHYGTVGLLEAIERFDPDYGVEFRTFARKRVRGAIFNGIGNFVAIAREHSTVDRNLRDRAQSLIEDSGHDPLQDLIGLSIGLAIGHLLENGIEHADGKQVDEPYAAMEQLELEGTIRTVIDGMTEREQSVIRLHYFQQISFTDIATLLNISKGRVSQLHRQGLNRIKQHFDDLRERDIIV